MNVVVSGYGAMGTRLVEASVNEQCTIVGVVDPHATYGLQSFSELSQVPDVIIDFSHPSRLHEMLDYAQKHNVALVIATTNFNQKQLDDIEDASQTIPILLTSNTSLGVSALHRVLELITPLLDQYDIEIIEKHHNQKIDAPSGTAKSLVKTIQSVKQLTPVYGREGESKRDKNDIGIHAVRGGTIAGEHSILFSGNDEIIEIKHTALSKQIFVSGAYQAARFIVTKTQGLFSMKDVG